MAVASPARPPKISAPDLSAHCRAGSPVLFVVVVGASLIRAVTVLCLPAMCGRALDTTLTHSAAAAGAHPAGGSPTGWVSAGIGLMALAAGCESAASAASGALIARSTAGARQTLVGHVIRVGPDLLRTAGVGDVVTRIVASAGQAATRNVRLAAAVISALPVLGGVALMFCIDMWCAVVFAVGLGCLAVLSRRLLTATREVNTAYLAAQARIANALIETVSGALTVAAAGTAAIERHRVLAALPHLGSNGRRLWRIQAAATARGTVLLPLVQVVVLAIAGARLAAGHLSVGAFFAIGGYLALGGRLIAVLNQLAALGQTEAAARRCGDLLRTPAPRYGGLTPSGGPGAVHLDGVTVDRPGVPALHRVDVEIWAGQSIALAGRDGCGAATFAALIGRMIDPDAGTVRLDETDLREFTADALHRRVTYAFDRPVLLGGTIAETIALRSGPIEPALIVAASRAACAEEFITRLPDGYDTALRAAPLSGGEAQRLGLARAFAHPAQVLVLDDATSSLDTVTEHRISIALAAAHGRTRIVLARRASTAARAQRVLWFENGRIRGDGAHHDLWSDPDYRAVFEATAVEPNAHRAVFAL